MQEKEIIKNTSIFTIARYSAYFFTILAGFIIARSLGPTLFGVYSALMLVTTYSMYSYLILLLAMTKKVPFYNGKKELEKAEDIEKTVFGGSVLIILVISILLVISSFLIKNVSQSTIKGIRIVAVIVILQQVFYFYQHYFRAEKKFQMMGKSMVIYSIAFFALVITLIRFNVEGVLLSMLIAYFMVIIYFFRKAGFKAKLPNPRKMLSLTRIGFPLLTISVMTIIFISIDKIMIIKFMDTTSLGYYSFALLIAGIVLFIPQSVGSVLFPYTLERYGIKENMQHIKNYLFQPTFAVSYLIPIVIGLVFITAPILIYYLLPDYLPGLAVFKILVCSVFFMSLTEPSNNLLVALNREKTILSLQAVSIILAVVLNYIFIVNGYGITGIAIATAISYFFYNINLLIQSFGHYIKGILNYLRFFMKIYAPIVYVVIILLFLDMFPATGILMKDVFFTIVKIILFGVLGIPLVWIANKKTGIIKIFLSLVFKRGDSN